MPQNSNPYSPLFSEYQLLKLKIRIGQWKLKKLHERKMRIIVESILGKGLYNVNELPIAKDLARD